jgi:large subunit ribosomal protein L22
MSIIVKSRNFGVAPRKVRQVLDLVRKKSVYQAMKTLRFCEKREISTAVAKLINTALDQAQKDQKTDIENLVIDEIFADEGPTQKRIQPRAQGRDFRIRKRSSHITLKLSEQ